MKPRETQFAGRIILTLKADGYLEAEMIGRDYGIREFWHQVGTKGHRK